MVRYSPQLSVPSGAMVPSGRPPSTPSASARAMVSYAQCSSVRSVHPAARAGEAISQAANISRPTPLNTPFFMLPPLCFRHYITKTVQGEHCNHPKARACLFSQPLPTRTGNLPVPVCVAASFIHKSFVGIYEKGSRLKHSSCPIDPGLLDRMCCNNRITISIDRYLFIVDLAIPVLSSPVYITVSIQNPIFTIFNYISGI